MKHPYPSFYAIAQSMEKVTAEMSVREIRVRHIEYAHSSEEWDDSLGILVCFEKNDDLKNYRACGALVEIESRFTYYLETAKLLYGISKIPKLEFQFDSH